ncbi:MAG: hypothetical protein ACPLRN_03785 [Microgenomates group bacterium]
MMIVNYSFYITDFWIKKPGFANLINFIGKLYTGYEPEFLFFDKFILRLSLFLIFIVTIGYVLFKNKKTSEKNIFRYLLIWAIFVPFVITLLSFIKPLFLPRYLIFASLGLILLIIYIIEKLPFLLKVVVLIILINFTFTYHRLQIKERKKADLRKTIFEIKKLMSKNDLLYVVDERDFFTAQYYLDEKKVYIWGKTYEEIPQYVGKVLIPKEKIALNLPIYPNKAFILNRDGQYTIQALY